MRSAASCVGPARCEHACYDTLKLHYATLTHFVGDIHRPQYNYKFKFKFSGCSNDCTNSIFRSDMAVIGMWRDSIQVDYPALHKWIDRNGFDHERIGETIERVGLKQFLDGVGLEASIDMVTRPRNNPYYKSEY